MGREPHATTLNGLVIESGFILECTLRVSLPIKIKLGIYPVQIKNIN